MSTSLSVSSTNHDGVTRTTSTSNIFNILDSHPAQLLKEWKNLNKMVEITINVIVILKLLGDNMRIKLKRIKSAVKIS